MENLNDYYSAFFDDAKKYGRICLYLQGFTFILVVLSIWILESYFLYAAALLGVAAEFIAWQFKHEGKQREFLGHRVQRMAMIVDAYGEGTEVYGVEYSNLIGTSKFMGTKKGATFSTT